MDFRQTFLSTQGTMVDPDRRFTLQIVNVAAFVADMYVNSLNSAPDNNQVRISNEYDLRI